MTATALLAAEKPRRFLRAAQPAGATPGAGNMDGADSAGGAEQDSTDLAGAA